MNAWAPATLSLPSSTPAYSTWRKHVFSSAEVVGRDPPFGIVNGGDDAYERTIGRVPLPSPAVKSTP